MVFKGVEEEMIANNISITKFQLFFILIQGQIGIGLLSLPHDVQKTANGSAWISTIVAGIAVQLILTIYWLLLRRFPNTIFTTITQKILGRFLGRVLNFVIYLYFILIGSFSAVLFIRLVNAWLLPLTPPWVLSIIILIASIYLTISDLRIIARFFVLASSLLLLLLCMAFLSFFLDKEFQYILPIGYSGIKNILMGSNNSLLSMLGFESTLIIFPFILNNKKGVLKTISLSNLFITSFYTFFIFLCLIIFSPSQLVLIREPILYLFKGLHYNMIDRLDLVFISIWIVPMTTSIIIYLFLASKTISYKNSYPKIVVLNGIIIFFMTFIPKTDEMISIINKYISYVTYTVVFLVPTFLLFLSYILKRHEMSETG